jgi:GMP synthase (glutamine-hydrolysing)
MYNAHFDYIDRAPLFFNIIARDPNGIIYGMKHIYKPIYGIQFHPEFSNFGNGLQIYKNFLKICGINPRDIEYSDIPEVKHKDSKKLID